MKRKNVLLITMDQLRADCVSGAIGDALDLPNLRALMADALYFSKHFSVATPCGPARASILTGLYAMNHRSVRNGAPLDARHNNIALELRNYGYAPLLFGYTDTSLDPRGRSANDPDLRTYEGVLPGFREVVRQRSDDNEDWLGYLRQRGYVLPKSKSDIYGTVNPDGSPSDQICDPARFSAEDSESAYLTDQVIGNLAVLNSPGWFAHVTYIKPHPPLVAPAPYNRSYDPCKIPDAVRPSSVDEQIDIHPFFRSYFSEPSNRNLFAGFDGRLDKLGNLRVRELRAIYCGLIAELDNQIGRLIGYLKSSGLYDDTLIIVTSDHGEMLGDHFMWGKEAIYDAAFHVPLIIRDPRRRATAGKKIEQLTESIDLAPTIVDWIGGQIPESWDGMSLIPWLNGARPSSCRTHVFGEIDLANPIEPTRYQRQLGLKMSAANLAVLRTERCKLVHFNGGLPPLLFDLAKDPDELVNLANNPDYATELQMMMTRMLDHRMSHADQTLSRMALTSEGVKSASPRA